MRLGEGELPDDALRATLGRDTRSLDAALRLEIHGEFQPVPAEPLLEDLEASEEPEASSSL